MRVWLTCFVMLFAIAELYQWAKHLMLPLPIYILGGVFLAIASNYSRITGFSFVSSITESTPLAHLTPSTDTQPKEDVKP